jgi:hypothetical protein
MAHIEVFQFYANKLEKGNFKFRLWEFQKPLTMMSLLLTSRLAFKLRFPRVSEQLDRPTWRAQELTTEWGLSN